MEDEYFQRRAGLLAVYRSLGWPLFAVKPRSKHPATPHGFKDATTDGAAWREWWKPGRRYNIGLPTGLVSGLCVLDIDPRSGGDKSFAELEAVHGAIAGMFVCATAGGGAHHYFRARAPHRTRELAAGIDWKADGGYVLLPPSIHPNGLEYKWARPPRPGVEVSIPEWVGADRKAEPPRQVMLPGRPRKVEQANERYFLAAANTVRRRLLAQREGNRNNSLNSAAFFIGRISHAGGPNVTWALQMLSAAGQHIGLDPVEVEATVRSGYSAGVASPLEIVWERRA